MSEQALRPALSPPLVLSRPVSLLALVAVAFLLADLAIISLGIRGDFAFDFSCCYQQAGQRLLEGRDLYDWSAAYTFRYSPWAALAFAPLAPLSPAAAAMAWLALKAGLLVIAAVWFSAPWSGASRWAAAAAVLLFPPAIHDLMIGNISVVTLITLLALARWRDVPGGALFGLLLLLAPKPHLLPIAIWLAVMRPRAALAAIGVAGGGAALGTAVFGIDAWLAYLGTFREPLAREFTANIGFSGLLGPPGVVLGVVAAVGVLALALRRPGTHGLGLGIVSGVLLGPYTFIHYLAGVIVAAEPVLRRRPRALAPFPLLMLVVPLVPLWLLALAGVQFGLSRSGVAGSARPEAAPAAEG